MLLIPVLVLLVTAPEDELEYFFGIIIGLILVPAVTGFYGCYYYLFPRHLQRQQLGLSIAIGGLISFVGVVLGVLCLYLTNEFVLSCYQESDFIALPIMFVIAIIFSWVAIVLRGFATWYNEITVKEALQRQNFEMEMKLVKAQLDPHFLFNTLNNIDILIEQDANKASAYLNQLSDIMRFMLFETKTQKIPLSKEIEYIKKYMALQRIRTANPTFASLEIVGDPQQKTIAPMVFIPFIENAFKHTHNKKLDDAVKVRIEISKDVVTLHCKNKTTIYQPENIVRNGLGNNLISKRLQLLYPKQHELKIEQQTAYYRVYLSLQYV